MEKNENETNQYPPVVSVLGHVDHGKTSLLDAIRKTNIASRETGGITQSIGASQIEIEHEGKKRKITFIDTPGHEAFSNMRSQGVSAADIVLLVVAANDGIKPQTKESIDKIKEANIPSIVVFTKIDLPEADIEKAKRQVLTEGLLLEGLGGDIPYIGVSSKTGEKIKDLLDLIVLVYDVSGIKKDKKAEFLGVVIDSELDKRRGVVASLVNKAGSLAVGQNVYVPGKQVGKVRALIDAAGKNVKEVNPGDAFEILGLTEVLPTGSVLYNVQKTLEAKIEAKPTAKVNIMQFLEEEDSNNLRVILKTQTSGEYEAIKNSLPEGVEVVYQAQGDIGVSDILMAKDFKALVLGFNVNINSDAKQLADNEKVFYKNYRIIYELLDEMNEAILGIEEDRPGQVLGQGNIIASFPSSEGRVLGVRVMDGRLAVNDPIRIFRGDKELGRSKIVSIKRAKENVKNVAKGIECGVIISPSLDFYVGDMLLSYNKFK